MTCSAPADCALIEERHSSGHGLLADGGASRSNLLSGDADQVILTVSRMEAEKKANPGYRAYLADGYNVTRTFVLFFYEVILELAGGGAAAPARRAAARAPLAQLRVHARRPLRVRARLHRAQHHQRHDDGRAGGLRLLRRLRRGRAPLRPRARATPWRCCASSTSSSGASRAPGKYAARPYEIVVLSDHGQTQGATFLQRNGYGLDELVERNLQRRRRGAACAAGDENDSAVSKAVREATGRKQKDEDKHQVGDRKVVVMGSGNLGLIYLMDEPRRMTMEEIDERHPDLLPALRAHPHVGWLLVRSAEHGAVALGARGANYLSEGRVEGEDPLAPFSPTAAAHLLRTDGFAHVADIMVNSFYDEQLDEGCAFEELISFHGGMGGPQTRPFLLHPAELEAPDEPIIGAEAAHRVLAGLAPRAAGRRGATGAAGCGGRGRRPAGS